MGQGSESPPKKRAKSSKINSKTKTKYFFQPANNLTAKANIERQLPDENKSESSSSSSTLTASTVSAVTQASRPNSANVVAPPNSSPQKTPTKLIDYEKLIQEQQSSDDSFDGVRWGGSPKKAGKAANTSLAPGNSSSPLKNVTSPVLNIQSKFSSATMVNDEVDSVLSKYGAGFQDILSQTPTLTRTHSDTFENKSRERELPILKISPTLSRSKTIGVDEMNAFHRPQTLVQDKASMAKSSTSLTAASSSSLPLAATNLTTTSKSSLTNWLNKFEVAKRSGSDSDTKGSANELDSQTYTQSVVQDIDFEDNFSDSLLENEDDTIESKKVVQALLDPNTIIPDSKNTLDDKDFAEFSDFSDEDNQGGDTVEQEGTAKHVVATEKPIYVDEEISFSSDGFSEDDNDKMNNGDSEKNQVTVPSALSKIETIEDGMSSDDPFSDDDDINFISKPVQSEDADSLPRGVNDLKNLKLTTSSSLSPEPSPLAQGDESKLSFSRSDLKRFQIERIIMNKYKVQNKVQDQIILGVKDSERKKHNIVVRGEYVELDYQIGDVIHIIKTGDKPFNLVDNQTNLLIWNPDILVSATTVSQQMTCPRKTVLVSKLRYPGESSKPLVVGTIIHIIFQACLAKEDWSDAFMHEILERELEFHLLEIFSIGDLLNQVREDLISQFAYLKHWFNSSFKKPLTSTTSIPTNQRNQDCQLSVSNVLDVEENIWSPMFGIKGMVDVTLEADIKRKAVGSTPGKFLIPMEIKSGKEYLSHHAQSSLYALLFKDRYDVDVNSFLLLYTKEQIFKLNDISQTDLKSLINLRNRLTKYLKGDTRELPDLLRSSVCDRCDVQSSCMTINRLVENGSQEESGLPGSTYNDITEHLVTELGFQHYKEFYEYWDEILAKEESVITSLKKDLWTLTAKEREEQGGKALADLVITETNDEDDEKRFVYTFERQNKLQGDSLQFSQLTKNDRVIISDEVGHFAIAQGFILSIRSNQVILSSDRRIMDSDIRTQSFNDRNHQTFQGVLHKTQKASSPVKDDKLKLRSFRIDKDDMFHGMGLARYNIINLFLKWGDSSRRDMVVNLKTPRFRDINAQIDKSTFNPDQINAFQKVLSAEDYCLILGMPGTGKTTVIARIIQFLVSMGKSVLLASYTHSAVDNILLKVKDLGVNGILRIGHPSRVHKDLQEFVVSPSSISNYGDFKRAYFEPLVVATTCLGIGDIAFTIRNEFDYCIIDEASQVSMPVSLGPLRFCKTFVLVGDHHQLPPLVQHPDAVVKEGLSQSLFKILGDKHPSSLVELTYQYRMCEEIMYISNILTYNGRLKCGNNQVANQSLYLPQPHAIRRFVDESVPVSTWMDKVLDPSNKVIFLNHDKIDGYERIVGEKIENPTEVDLIYQIIESLSVCGVDERSIGVMSLYRAQLRLLNRKLYHRPNVEVLTADQFQGKDKDCIIISLVRSNKENRVGDLLKDWRRINVAVTRSKSKLIVLGSKSTLKNSSTLGEFIDIVEKKGWIHDLEEGSTSKYNFLFEEKESPVKRSLSSTTKISEKLISKHPILKDILNESKPKE